MLATKLSTSLNKILTSLLNLLVGQSKKAKARVYDYTRFTPGQDYVFETKEDGTTGYMTAQLSGVQSGDYIILSHDSHKRSYQVEEIDYYSEPADMWMALLRLVEDNGI